MSDNNENNMENAEQQLPLEEAVEEAVEESAAMPEEQAAEKPAADAESVAEEGEEESSDESGGIFSKLQKKRQERMEAVGEDDDYDIFDLQELMDIPADDEVFDETPADEAGSLLDQLEAAEDEPEASDDEKKPKEKKRGFFSRFRREKPASQETDILPEEELAAQADEGTEAEPVESEEPQEADAEEETAAEEEPVEEYVSPLSEMESFERERLSAISDINKTLAGFGIGEIETPEAEQPQEDEGSVEDQLDGLFDEQMKDVPEEKTKLGPIPAKEGGAEFKVMPENDAADEDEDELDQIQLDDYDAESVEPEIVDEREEELKLERKRQGWIEKFHLDFGQEDEEQYVEPKTEGTADVTEDVEVREGEGVFEAVARTAREKLSFLDALRARVEKKEEEEHLMTITEIVSRLAADKKKIAISFFAEAVLAVALLVFAILGASYEEGGALSGLFAHGGRIYVLINLLIYAAGAGFALSGIKKAIDRVRAGYLDSRAVFLCLNIFVIFEMLLALCTGLNENSCYVVYAFAGVISFLAENISAKINCDSLSKSLAVLTKNKLRSIRPVEKNEESAVLGYDLAANGDPSIYFSADVRLPENIAYLTENTSKEQKVSRLFIAIPFITGLVLSVVACIIRKSAMPLVSVLPCTLCITLPVFRPLILSLFKAEANRGSIVNGVSVLSYDDCDEVARANAVVVDASEILGVTVSDFRKARGTKMAKTDTAVFTAAVLKKSGSMLSSCFDGFIEGMGIDLPAAEDFSYEQGLGFSAWVSGSHVIVGTRKCIELHSIECPTEEQEKAYCSDAFVLYTCVDDRIVATFKANYLPRRNTRKQIDALRRSGIVIMLNCAEPSLNDEKAAELMHCSVAEIKIISSNGRDIIAKCRTEADSSENNGVFAVKKKRNVLLAVAEAYSLSIRRRTSKTVGFIIAMLMLAVYAACILTGFSTAFSPLTAVAFSAVAAAVTFAVGKLSNK